jgi:transposase-like protein
MSRRPTLTQAQLDELRAEYESWNPYDTNGPTAEEIAARHGVSKNTMYTWRSRGWRLNGREGDGQSGWKPRGGNTPDETAGVIQYLTDELVKAKVENQRLRERLNSTNPGNDEGPPTRT